MQNAYSLSTIFSEGKQKFSFSKTVGNERASEFLKSFEVVVPCRLRIMVRVATIEII